MNDLNFSQHDDSDRQLWKQFVYASNEKAPDDIEELDPNALAAYLDGTGDETLNEKIDHLLSKNDSRWLEAVMELRQILGSVDSISQETLPEIPKEVIRRAKALVDRTVTSTEMRSVPRLTMKTWWGPLQWAAAAVLVLASGLVGYEAGSSTYAPDRFGVSTQAQAAIDFEQMLDDPPLLLIALAGGNGR